VAGRCFFRSLTVLGLLIAMGAVYQTLVVERRADRQPVPGALVDVGGRRLHLVCAGEGSPTVLFEAGGTHFSSQYMAVQRQMATRTRACAYDRAGWGFSDARSDPLTVRALADDLAALVTRASIAGPYVLVASSAGGVIAEYYARQHRNDVVGLVLLDALASSMLDALPDEAHRLHRRARLARALSRIGVLDLMDPLHRGDLPDGEREVALALTYRRHTWDSICSLIGEGSASAEELRLAPPLRPDLPLVVVTHDPASGAEDASVEPIWQAEQAKSAGRSSEGRLVIARGSGHHITDDRPDIVVEEVSRMIERIRVAAARAPDREKL
jgi:pimeloyl-ACP methyl ester carboxylesterase